MIQDNISRQIEREDLMVKAGIERAIQRDAQASSVGEQTRLERMTLAHLLPQVSNALQAQIASYEGKPRKPEWFAHLTAVDLDAAAAEALRSGFQSAMKRAPLTRTLVAMARALEVLLVHTQLAARAQTKAQKERVKGLTSLRKTQHARKAAILRAGGTTEEPHTSWTVEAATLFGQPMLNAVLATDLFDLSRSTVDGLDTFHMALSEDGQLAAREIDLGVLARPLMRPMLTQPREWETPLTGAYVTEAVRLQTPLVRTDDKSHRKLLAGASTAGTLAPVLEAVSAIQSTPLRINKAVLALREWAMDTRLKIKDVLPLIKAVDVSEVPEDLEGRSTADQRRFWAGRAQAARVNQGITPNLTGFRSSTQEAKDLAKEDRFYLPANLDFRGRVYPVPAFSHHTGDATKALFEFARGEPLGDDGLGWLMIHTANCGDFDKVSKRPYQDRVAWCEENEELIRRVAADPQVNLEWTLADAPFSFYAACVDLAAAWDNDHHVSHLPIALDGSNSGVQHYSAAMRAPEGAYVNLTSVETPADLYQTVADRCQAICAKADLLTQRKLAGVDILAEVDKVNADIDLLMAPVRADPTGKVRLDATGKRTLLKLKGRRAFLCAILWARHKVTRSIVKRSVMTFGYSSVAFGFAQQIREDFMGPLTLQVLQGDLDRHPFGLDEGRACAGVLGRLIYASVTQVLPYVASAMQWLQHTAGVLAGENKGVLMVSPLGFPMLMKVTEKTVKRVALLLLDKAIPVSEARPEVDRVVGDSVLRRVRTSTFVGGSSTVMVHKQRSGVAPNVVHTMDGAHLQLAALECKARGINDLLLIHDSFATHAGRTGEMSMVLRETLVDLYSTYCPFQDIYDRAQAALSDAGKALLLPPPAKGDLDLSGILNAEYAFS